MTKLEQKWMQDIERDHQTQMIMAVLALYARIAPKYKAPQMVEVLNFKGFKTHKNEPFDQKAIHYYKRHYKFTDHTALTAHWNGDHELQNRHLSERPCDGLPISAEQTEKEVYELVKKWKEEEPSILNSVLAERLNQMGYRTVRQRKPFSRYSLPNIYSHLRKKFENHNQEEKS